jgi:NAD(P)-dependent dehydrogenase (short-subunit alcohol dehydrogenase family)
LDGSHSLDNRPSAAESLRAISPFAANPECPVPKPLVCDPSLFSQDLSGRTIVVTGGNSGIGLVTVEQLAKQGATVVLAARRPAEGERARAEVLQRVPGARIEVAELDLAKLASVRAFATALLARNEVLHGLVNNAGVMNTPQSKTHDGFEMQFGTNHLGHFLLTELLLPALQKGAPSRIVNVSSCLHDMAQGFEGRIDFDDPNFERRKYEGWEAYAQSKLANVLHAKSLAKRLAGTGVTAVSVHPGWVRTNLIRHSLPVWMQNTILRPVLFFAGMIEPWEGTQTTLYALLAPEVAAQPGAFFSQTGVYRDKAAKKGGWPLHSPNPHAHDQAAANRLDAMSRTLVGLA